MSDGMVHLARSKTSQLTIGIVGAGIAGLALAIALKRKGFAPVVLERRARDQLSREGIFLTLAPNGLNAIGGLGLIDAVLANGIVTTGLQLHNENGRDLGRIDYSANSSVFGAPSVTIRRGALGEVLLATALSEGVSIRFGAAIDGVAESHDWVTVVAGGESLILDLLVAADGLRSTVRRLAMPHLPQPVFNGLIGSGGIVEVPGVEPTNGQMLMTFGRRAFFGYIKKPGGPVYWFDSFVGDETTGRVGEAGAFMRHLRELHRDDPLDNYKIVEAQQSPIDAYPDYDMPSLSQWFTNRIVLMGDAAHAVTPHSGQGASMALEDALVLAACLEAEMAPVAAFRRFESLRRARVEAAVALGRQSGQQKKAQSWLGLRIRDLILPLVLPLGQKAQEKLFQYRVDREPLVRP